MRPTRFAFAASPLVLAILTSAGAARGADPLNSNDRVGEDESVGTPHDDFNIVPVAGGDTDIGVGGGYFLGLARHAPHLEPYEWNVESAGFLSFKDEGGLVTPYQDVYAKLTVPRIFGRGLRLELRPSYTWEQTLGYYGLGDVASPGATPGKRFEFGRIHPAMDVLARVRIVDHVSAITGFRYTQNWIEVRSGTKLADDLASGSPEVKDLLGPVRDHAVALFKYGVAFDTRDSEVSAHEGTFDEVTVKLSPGGAGAFPYRYGQATFIGRVYVPVWPPQITLAARLVGDALFGDPPFYELARYEDTYALGGSNGVRGVPAQRYAGKVKTFGNVELRTELTEVHLFHKAIRIGAAGFFDAGRVWADLPARPELDGTTLGLKVGAGAGLRFHSGETFVLRVDGAWSPDANPLGGYVAAGEMF